MICVILCQTNACMQHFQFVRAFYCADSSQAIPAYYYSQNTTAYSLKNTL